jgi:hypothetical protein
MVGVGDSRRRGTRKVERDRTMPEETEERRRAVPRARRRVVGDGGRLVVGILDFGFGFDCVRGLGCGEWWCQTAIDVELRLGEVLGVVTNRRWVE